MLSPTAAAAAASPQQRHGGKYRTVSVFSSTGNLAATGAASAEDRASNASGDASSSAASGKSSSQHLLSSDPSRLSVFGSLAYAADNNGANTAGGGGLGSPRPEKYYLKVHIGDHESHILGLFKSQLLAEALPLLSAKKHVLVAMKAENYRFTYVDPLLRSQNEALRDMTKVLIGQLMSDELNLTPRLGPGGDQSSGMGAALTTPSLLPSDDSSSDGSTHHATMMKQGSQMQLDATSLSSFQFSAETAGTYCESVHRGTLMAVSDSLFERLAHVCALFLLCARRYKVVKTNQRGKRQHRIFGVDRYKIYNKTSAQQTRELRRCFSPRKWRLILSLFCPCPFCLTSQSGADEGDGGGMFSFFKKSMLSGEPGVSRAFRMINTIASVHVVSLRPTCFCINFKADARKDSPIAQSREYETETKTECAEIVAKLKFLVSIATPADSVHSEPTMLAQSIK